MKKQIIMIIDNEEYVFGTYQDESSSDKINMIAQDLKRERGIEVYIKEISEE